MRPLIIAIVGDAGSGKSLFSHLWAERLLGEGHIVYSNIFINGCQPLYLDKFLNFEYQNCWCVIDEAPAWFDCRESMGKNKKEHLELSKIIFQHRKKHVGIIWNAQLKESVEWRLPALSEIQWECEGHYSSGEAFYDDKWPIYFRFICVKGPHEKKLLLFRENAMRHANHFDSYQVVLTMEEEKAKIIQRTNGSNELEKPKDTMLSHTSNVQAVEKKKPRGHTADQMGGVIQWTIYCEDKEKYPKAINSFEEAEPDIIIPEISIVKAIKAYTIYTPSLAWRVEGGRKRHVGAETRWLSREMIGPEYLYAYDHVGWDLEIVNRCWDGPLKGKQANYLIKHSELSRFEGVLVKWEDHR